MKNKMATYEKILVISCVLLIVIIIVECKKHNFMLNDGELPETVVSTTEVAKKPIMSNVGKYTVTAYCSCSICCGKWAKCNNNNGVVTGAGGKPLISGYSCATSNRFDFGTKLYIEGYGIVEVQDRISDNADERYNGYTVDVYFNDHDEALNFDMADYNVCVIESE